MDSTSKNSQNSHMENIVQKPKAVITELGLLVVSEGSHRWVCHTACFLFRKPPVLSLCIILADKGSYRLKCKRARDCQLILRMPKTEPAILICSVWSTGRLKYWLNNMFCRFLLLFYFRGKFCFWLDDITAPQNLSTKSPFSICRCLLFWHPENEEKGISDLEQSEEKKHTPGCCMCIHCKCNN